MKQSLRSVLIAAGVLSSLLVSSTALAEVTANAAVTSNYIWRGLTQTDDGPAVQGGVDYSHESGLAVGVWGSNVDEGIEYDLYGSFSKDVGNDLGFSLGINTYNYTDDEFSENFSEYYIGGSFKMVSLTYYMGDYDGTDYTYIDLSAEFDLKGVGLGLHYGSTDVDVPGGAGDYDDYSISVGKDFSGFNISVAYASEDANDEDAFFVTVAKDFEL
jgi:uncharacterized protein (TIGR02001 family)